jgi:hypothetical protein
MLCEYQSNSAAQVKTMTSLPSSEKSQEEELKEFALSWFLLSER